MPRLLKGAGALSLAYGAWKLWSRLPKPRQQQVIQQARKHGPTVAKSAAKYAGSRLKAR
jgi:hypothetical protein